MCDSEPVSVDLEVCAVISWDQEELDNGSDEREPEEVVEVVGLAGGVMVVGLFGRDMGCRDLFVLVGGAAVVVLTVVHTSGEEGWCGGGKRLGIKFCRLSLRV